MKDDFKKLAKLVKRATNAGMEIKANYVKGHSGVEGNVEANRLAQRYTIKLAKFKEAEIGQLRKVEADLLVGMFLAKSKTGNCLYHE